MAREPFPASVLLARPFPAARRLTLSPKATISSAVWTTKFTKQFIFAFDFPSCQFTLKCAQFNLKWVAQDMHKDTPLSVAAASAVFFLSICVSQYPSNWVSGHPCSRVCICICICGQLRCLQSHSHSQTGLRGCYPYAVFLKIGNQLGGPDPPGGLFVMPPAHIRCRHTKHPGCQTAEGDRNKAKERPDSLMITRIPHPAVDGGDDDDDDEIMSAKAFAFIMYDFFRIPELECCSRN